MSPLLLFSDISSSLHKSAAHLVYAHNQLNKYIKWLWYKQRIVTRYSNMSFGQPPPMSRYGDKDFIKEDLDPNQSQKSPLYTTQAYSPADHDPNAPPVQRPVKMSNLSGQIARSEITEEDRLFMKSWREDCFYYRGECSYK